MNLTLVNVAGVHVLRPLSRSGTKLETISDILNNPRITPLDLQASFARYIAVIIKARVQEAILRQKLGRTPMSQVYEPLSREYAASKPKHLRDKFWMNTSHLLNSLVVWRAGDVVKIGFKGSAHYPGTTTRVMKVVLWNEKGTKRIPPRPLFVPIAKFISKNIGRYFEAYVKHQFRIDVKTL